MSYDSDDFISASELETTKHLADKILEYLEQELAIDVKADPENKNAGFRTQTTILNEIGRDHIRLWEPAISRLVEDVESVWKVRTLYRRRDLRRTPPRTGSNEEMFKSMPPKNKAMPFGAFGGKK